MYSLTNSVSAYKLCGAFLFAILNIVGALTSSRTGTPRSLIAGINPAVAPETTRIPP